MFRQMLAVFHGSFAFRFNKIPQVATLFLMLVGIVILGAGKSGWLAFTATSGKNVAQQPSATPTPEPITAESLTLTETGFFPREFTHRKGRFILAINDRTGLPEVNLTLSRDLGNNKREKVRDAKVLRQQPDWNDLIDLNPGDYVITEANNPKWECRFTITPN